MASERAYLWRPSGSHIATPECAIACMPVARPSSPDADALKSVDIWAGLGSGSLQLIRPSSDKAKLIEVHHHLITDIAVAGDNLWCASFDGNVTVMDRSSQSVVGRLKVHDDAVTSLCLLPNGIMISGGLDGKVVQWDASTRRAFHTLSLAQAANIAEPVLIKDMKIVGKTKIWIAARSKIFVLDIQSFELIGVISCQPKLEPAKTEVQSRAKSILQKNSEAFGISSLIDQPAFSIGSKPRPVSPLAFRQLPQQKSAPKLAFPDAALDISSQHTRKMTHKRVEEINNIFTVPKQAPASVSQSDIREQIGFFPTNANQAGKKTVSKSSNLNDSGAPPRRATFSSDLEHLRRVNRRTLSMTSASPSLSISEPSGLRNHGSKSFVASHVEVMAPTFECVQLRADSQGHVWSISSHAKEIHVWNASKMTLVDKLSFQHQTISCLCPVGDYMWAGCASGDILVWDTVLRTVVQQIVFHADSVRTLSLSNGMVVSVSAAMDGSIGLWRTLDSGKNLLKLKYSFLSASPTVVRRGVSRILQRKKRLKTGDHYNIFDGIGFELDPRSQAQSDRTVVSHLIKPDLQAWTEITSKQGQVVEPLTSRHLHTLVQCGVPPTMRADVWRFFLRPHSNVAADRQTYERLCKRGPSPSHSAILLDLNRTFPCNRLFENAEMPYYRALGRILDAFATVNLSTGYCQGLNFLAGFALLFQEETAAFWTLTSIVNHIMPDGYYEHPMVSTRADQRVLVDLVAQRLPAMAEVFSDLDIDISLVTFQWFFTLFVDIVESELTVRIWDAVFLQGRVALFKYALALLKVYEEDIVTATDRGELMTLLKTMGLHLGARVNTFLMFAAECDVDPDFMEHLFLQHCRAIVAEEGLDMNVSFCENKQNIQPLDSVEEETRASSLAKPFSHGMPDISSLMENVVLAPVLSDATFQKSEQDSAAIRSLNQAFAAFLEEPTELHLQEDLDDFELEEEDDLEFDDYDTDEEELAQHRYSHLPLRKHMQNEVLMRGIAPC